MPDAPGFAGIEGQHVALLTTRAALSLFSAGRAGRGGAFSGPPSSAGDGFGGAGGSAHGGPGGKIYS